MARRDDDDYEDEDRPRKKRRKQASSGTTLIIILAVGFGASFFCCIPISLALFLPAIQQAREAARRTEEKNHLKIIGLAVHNFEGSYTHFPPRDLQPGDVRQSWLTELLPYVDQAPLYNSVNRQAPWDDASNRAAMSAAVPVFLNPTLADRNDPVSGYALAHFAGNVHLFGREQPIRFSEINDGTSNTMLAGSVMEGLRPWGDPGNLRDPSAGVGPGPNQFLRSKFTPRAAHVLLADGSVRYVSEDVAPAVMQGLANPDDGAIPPAF